MLVPISQSPCLRSWVLGLQQHAITPNLRSENLVSSHPLKHLHGTKWKSKARQQKHFEVNAGPQGFRMKRDSMTFYPCVWRKNKIVVLHISATITPARELVILHSPGCLKPSSLCSISQLSTARSFLVVYANWEKIVVFFYEAWICLCCHSSPMPSFYPSPHDIGFRVHFAPTDCGHTTLHVSSILLRLCSASRAPCYRPHQFY